MTNVEQATEEVDGKWKGMDQWSASLLSECLYKAQLQALDKTVNSHDQIAVAGDAVVGRLQGSQGRLVYCGAGSAGAQACVDGLELPGTYGWPKERLLLLLAGGWDSFLNHGGGAEDDVADAVTSIKASALTEDDVLIAVSASGTTAYTLAALEEAKKQGALCIGICNNPSALSELADICIVLETGSEAVAGSTRMAAGTAQKVALNSLSTLVMAKLGYLYDNLMIRLEVSNKKLVQRATKMVAQLCECDERQALQQLVDAKYQVPVAVLMHRGLSLNDSIVLLNRHQQNLRMALSSCA